MKFLKVATLAWGAVIFFFSIVNPPKIGPTAPSDLILHFAAYAFLAALAINSFEAKNKSAIVAAIMFYGISLEVLQHFVGRTFSFIDISVNCIGALTAAAIYCAVNRQNSKSQERV